METRSHRTQVLPLPNGKYAGLCSCGFATPRTDDRAGASAAINEHRYLASERGQLELSKAPHGAK